MSDAPQFVEIFTADADQGDTARKLLDAAGDTPEVVATVFGGFRVPAEVAAKAGFSASDEDAADAAAVEGTAADAVTPAPADDEESAEEPVEESAAAEQPADTNPEPDADADKPAPAKRSPRR